MKSITVKKVLFIMVCSLLLNVSRAQNRIARKVVEMGKTVYTQRCMKCHQVDGSGAQNMIPPLIGNEYILGDKVSIINIVLNGMTGEIKVDGDTYSGEMPSHKDLTDEQIAAVITYVRNSFGNKAEGVIKGEVTKVRAGK